MGPCYKTSKPTRSDLLYFRRLHLLKAPQPPQTAPSAGLWGNTTHLSHDSTLGVGPTAERLWWCRAIDLLWRLMPRWLPAHPFPCPSRLIAGSLWKQFSINPLLMTLPLELCLGASDIKAQPQPPFWGLVKSLKRNDCSCHGPLQGQMGEWTAGVCALYAQSSLGTPEEAKTTGWSR